MTKDYALIYNPSSAAGKSKPSFQLALAPLDFLEKLLQDVAERITAALGRIERLAASPADEPEVATNRAAPPVEPAGSTGRARPIR